jgi:hypothetical protein
MDDATLTGLVERCRELGRQGRSQEEIMAFLRAAGCWKLDSIKAMQAVYGLTLSQAKEAVHLSKTWEDMREADNRLHQTLARAFSDPPPHPRGRGISLIRRQCPVCRERGIPIGRFFAEPVHCDSCGRYFKRARVWGFLWRSAMPHFVVSMSLWLMVLAMVRPLSWGFAVALAILVAPFVIDDLSPLEQTRPPSTIVRSHPYRMLQSLVIIWPLLQWIIPFLVGSDHKPNLPVAIALAAVAAGVITYGTLLHGQYYFYRGMERARSGAVEPTALPKARLGFTLFPVFWGWLSLGAFYLQLTGPDGFIWEFGLASLAAVIALIVLLVACYWAGTRRRPTSLVFH